MTINRLEMYGIALVFLVVIVVGCAYVSSKVDVTKADTVKQMVAEQTAQIQKTLEVKLSAIEADKKQATTPQVIVQKIPQYVPLPSPPQLVSTPVVAAPVVSSPTPDLPQAPQPQNNGGILFPAEDVKPLFDHLADCQACSLKLEASESQNQLLTKRAEAAETSAKGGNFFTRVKSNAKWLGIGIASGAAVVCGTGHCK